MEKFNTNGMAGKLNNKKKEFTKQHFREKRQNNFKIFN